MSDPTGRTHQLVIAYAGLALGLGTSVYAAGALGQRVDNNTKRLERLEERDETITDMRERLARIEAKLDNLAGARR